MLKKLKEWMNPKSEVEYSKVWMNRWQMFVMFWCAVFFIADIVCNGAEHSVELCVCLVTSVAATFVIYLPKAYFGKRNEEELKIIKEGYLDEYQENEEDDLK